MVRKTVIFDLAVFKMQMASFYFIYQVPNFKIEQDHSILDHNLFDKIEFFPSFKIQIQNIFMHTCMRNVSNAKWRR